MKDTILVNDKKLDWLIIGEGFEIPSFNFNTETIEVKGRPGTVVKDRKLGGYEFSIPLVIVNEWLENNKTHDDVLHDLVRFFNYGDEPVKLQIKSQNWYWNAYIEGPIEIPNKTTQFMELELKVVLADPYKYAIKGNQNTAISDQVSLVNSGTADTPVIIEARALKASSYFMVAKGDKDYFMIGDDNVNKVYKDYLPSIYGSELTNINGWTKQTSNNFTDNYTGGLPGGIFKQSDTRDSMLLDVDSVTSTSGWNGAMYKRSYTKSAQDFRSSVRFIIGQKNKGAVRAVQYVYDTDNRVIASLGYVNPSPSQNIGRVIITLFNQNGDQKKVYEYANLPKVQQMNDFVIYVQIMRVGNVFTLRSWKYTDQKQRIIFDENRQVFTDKGNFYTRPVSGVSIAEYKHGTDRTFPVFIGGSFNHEVLPKPPDANDMIIKAGDEIVIDTRTNSVIVNEENFLTQKSFGSNFFNIDSGYSELMIYPEGIFDTKVKWQDRYY